MFDLYDNKYANAYQIRSLATEHKNYLCYINYFGCDGGQDLNYLKNIGISLICQV